VQYESVETTLPKAKELVPYLEKLITKAKKGDLHNRRQVISGMHTVANAHKLVDEIAPKLKGRTSGHLRIVKTDARRGDNAQLARVSFVDELNASPVAKAATTTAKETNVSEVKATVKPKTTAKKTAKESK
jgi:large subunit ribosomal protein L17